MRINPVYNTNFYMNKPDKKTNGQTVFTAHPDFIRLSQKFNIKASVYFRRGEYFGFPSNAFGDIIDIFKGFFKYNTPQKPVKMLIGGIADSQEPFSYLAVIKELAAQSKLENILDLHTVDLQSKPGKMTLYQQSFYDYLGKPFYAPSSFICNNHIIGKDGSILKYRVKDELYDYLLKTYNNPEKSHWDSRIQEEIYKYPNENFDIISANNVLTYITSGETIINTVEQVIKLLKPGGIFITDPHVNYGEALKYGVDEIYKGIYRKKYPREVSTFLQNPFVYERTIKRS